MKKTIELFHFGDCGKYDKHNPLYLYEHRFVPEILYEIANSEPYQLTEHDISTLLQVELADMEQLLEKMKELNMISKKNDKYSIEFTVFLEKDLNHLKQYSQVISSYLANKILDKKEELIRLVSNIKCTREFGFQRILYHVIGCDIFDGTAIDDFADRGIFKDSKSQVDNRDYILFGFERSELVDRFSNKLLCSCNNCETEDVKFLSFGDGDGNRKDVYRFFRRINSKLNDVTEHKDLNLSYIKVLEKYNHKLLGECSDLIKKMYQTNLSVNNFNEDETDITTLLKELNYIKIDKDGIINFYVPTFDCDDMKVIKDISDLVIGICKPEISHEFSSIKTRIPKLSSVIHGIDDKEISNELWHQVFGNINEILVKKELFATPEYKVGEGRYFQALYIK